MKAIIEPGMARGRSSAPPSKSCAHRLLICAALAAGESRIDGAAMSQDILATMDCVQALGAEIREENGSLFVKGCGGQLGARDSLPVLSCRESGVVIATGGGSVLNPESVRRLKQNGLICFLDRPLEKLRPTGDRPLSSSTDALKKRFEERYPLYNAVCDRRLPADGTIEENVELVLEAAGFGRKVMR